jgi:nicotinate phosphoribosyltransferase
MKEGEIVFSNEPILSYTGPLGFVQMLETPCLNLLGFATLVATNASRMVKAVNGKRCLEFGTRRAQGPDGALSASQYAFLGGFVATSNVEAARKLQIKAIGTMSHAYVTAFSSLEDVESFNLGGVKLKERSIEIRN